MKTLAYVVSLAAILTLSGCACWGPHHEGHGGGGGGSQHGSPGH